MKRRLFFWGMCVLIVAALVMAEVARTSVPDMEPNYEHDANEALGGSILYRTLPDLLDGVVVERQQRSAYLTFSDETRSGQNYLILTEHFQPDGLITENLIAFAARGNAVFVSAHWIWGPLADTLGFRVRPHPPSSDEMQEGEQRLMLSAPTLSRNDGYRFREVLAMRVFQQVDTARTVVLGTVGEYPNYVRIGVGEGAVLVHLAPRAFSNYNLVAADGPDYAAAALSYLPSRPTIWDGVYKPQRTVGGSALRFVQETPALAWAYYLGLGGFVLFVLFRGRRWQRPVPVVRPPANQTVGFARAIARLWHERGKDQNLVERRAGHLLDRLRMALHEPTLTLDPGHAPDVARRLGLAESDVLALFTLIGRLRAGSVRHKDLLELDRRLDRIYHHL